MTSFTSTPQYTLKQLESAFKHSLVKECKDPFYPSSALSLTEQIVESVKMKSWFKLLEGGLLSKNGHYYFKWMTEVYEAFADSKYNHVSENILFYWGFYLRWNLPKIEKIDINTIRFYATKSLVGDSKLGRYAGMYALRFIPDRETLRILGSRLKNEEISTLRLELRMVTNMVLDAVNRNRLGELEEALNKA